MTPAALARELERGARLPDGPGDRFSGYAVLGLPFAAGHVLALRRFSNSSVGTRATTVWHRDPAGRWTFYSTVAPDESCARYFGGGVMHNVVTPIVLSWPTPWSLRLEVGERIDWTVTLREGTRTRLLNGLSAMLPAAAWRSPVASKAMVALSAAVLRAGPMSVTGLTPNGHRFHALPQSVWLVANSRATLDGRDLGPMAAVHPQAALADVRMPRRGLFAAVQVRMERPQAGNRASLRTLALRAAEYDLHALTDPFGVQAGDESNRLVHPPR